MLWANGGGGCVTPPPFHFVRGSMAHISGLGCGLVERGFYATPSLPDKNSYFSIIVAMPVDSPGFRTLRWMRPRQRTLTGVA
jgi:hypothetical protein